MIKTASTRSSAGAERCHWIRHCSSAFPEGYRHLAYVQSKVGFQVRRDLPSLRGPGGGSCLRAWAPRGWRAGRSRLNEGRDATPAASYLQSPPVDQ